MFCLACVILWAQRGFHSQNRKVAKFKVFFLSNSVRTADSAGRRQGLRWPWRTGIMRCLLKSRSPGLMKPFSRHTGEKQPSEVSRCVWTADISSSSKKKLHNKTVKNTHGSTGVREKWQDCLQMHSNILQTKPLITWLQQCLSWWCQHFMAVLFAMFS